MYSIFFIYRFYFGVKGHSMIKKKDKETKGELIFGIHPVVELLKAKRRKLISVYTTKPTPQSFDEIQKVWPKYP